MIRNDNYECTPITLQDFCLNSNASFWAVWGKKNPGTNLPLHLPNTHPLDRFLTFLILCKARGGDKIDKPALLLSFLAQPPHPSLLRSSSIIPLRLSAMSALQCSPLLLTVDALQISQGIWHLGWGRGGGWELGSGGWEQNPAHLKFHTLSVSFGLFCWLQRSCFPSGCWDLCLQHIYLGTFSHSLLS